MKKTNKILIKIIGVYQIIGGLFGLTLIFRQSFSYIFWNFIYFVFIFGLFAFSIISGIYLLKTKSLLKGIKYSIVNQALQLIQFEILGLGLYYVAGFYLALGFSDTPQLHLITDYSIFKSSCYLSFFRESNEITLSINVAAIMLLTYLIYLNNPLRINNKTIESNL